MSAETFFLLIQKLLTCSRGVQYITKESIISRQKPHTILSLHRVSICERNSVKKNFFQLLSSEWKKEEEMQTLFLKYWTCKKEHFLKNSYILDSTAIPIWQYWYLTSDFLGLCSTLKSTAWLCVKIILDSWLYLCLWFLLICCFHLANSFPVTLSLKAHRFYVQFWIYFVFLIPSQH